MRYLAPARAAVLAACTIGWSGASARPGADGTRIGAAKCEEPLRAQERAWRGAGEWRSLAPYPIPREASPTDSIGVWLERWHRPGGEIELRRVTAESTVVTTVGAGGCDVESVVHRRSFDASAPSDFTDAALRDLVRQNRAGMVYVWSPGMPLSVVGRNEARAAAQSLGISFTAIVADERASVPLERSLNSLELVYRNATIHYPSVTFYRDGALLGDAVPGFKSAETYVALARDAFAEAATGRSRWSTAVTEATPTLWVDHKARVTTTRTIPTPRVIGFFFKPIAGTDFISYTTAAPNPNASASYLFELGSRREIPIPGHVDPVPTPDGRFITRPGLLFHAVGALVAGDTSVMFADPELPDQYQTTSILKTARSSLRYRVITGWGMATKLREYDIALDRAGKATRVEPVGAPLVPCSGRAFSLPIGAKSGTEMGVYDKVSKTNRVVDVSAAGVCADRLDLGFASGKIAFSYDGSAIAFATSRVDVDAEGSLLKPEEMFYKDAIVLYRKTGRLVGLSANRPLSGMTFPEFLPDGRIILLDQKSRGRPTEMIRVVEVR